MMLEQRSDRRQSKPQTMSELPTPAGTSAPRPSAPADTGSEPRTICISVDDFGLNTGVNLAALQLAGMERVHAIGCRVGADHWRTWGKLLRRIDAHGMDLGLNLDLTEHRLAPGQGYGFEALVVASHGRTLRRASLLGEIRAQLDAFERVIGHEPAFVGGNRHVHQLPVVRDVLLDEIERRYGAYRPWLKSSTTIPAARIRATGGWRERVLRWCVEQSACEGLAALARQRGYRQNRHLLGAYDRRRDGRRYAEVLRLWLREAVDGDLLACRPVAGLGGDALVSRAGIEEFEVLSSAAFAELLDDSGITTWPMSQVLLDADSL